MAIFSHVFVLYNPISTGDSRKNAKHCVESLQNSLPKTTSIRLTKTEYAGHGRELARRLASAHRSCLIISSSGDGGYHDIVNGVIESGSTTAVTGLLPSGNANDHYHAAHQGNLVERIASGDVALIDLLVVEGIAGGITFKEYAHSYVGLGLTPHIGKELNKTTLNRFNELIIALKSLLSSHPVKIMVNGRTVSYRSVLFSNVARMAKVMSLSEKALPDDGIFEVNLIRSASFVHLVYRLLLASTRGLEEDYQTSSFKFMCPRPTLIQLDGEIRTLDARSMCKISIEPKRLRCIV